MFRIAAPPLRGQFDHHRRAGISLVTAHVHAAVFGAGIFGRIERKGNAGGLAAEDHLCYQSPAAENAQMFAALARAQPVFMRHGDHAVNSGFCLCRRLREFFPEGARRRRPCPPETALWRFLRPFYDDHRVFIGGGFRFRSQSAHLLRDVYGGVYTAEQERLGTELTIATQIQGDMLPSTFPAFPEHDEFDIYATMDPAKEVGGDFYDFFMVDDTHLAIVVADVSGKGVPAALFMVIAKTLIKDHTQQLKTELGEVFTKVNDLLCDFNNEGMFVTAFEGVLNLETGELTYVNAGHELPFVFRKKDGAFTPVKVRAGFVLAGMDGLKYRAGTMQLEEGDVLFQYTDGVTEATSASKELYGMTRLGAVLNANSDKTMDGLLRAVKDDIDLFVGDAEQFDDITMLGLKFIKKQRKQGDDNMKEITLDAVTENLSIVTDFINDELSRFDCSPKTLMQLDIAIDEIFGNIASYAYAPGTGKVTVRIGVDEDPATARITFIDEGVPYDPLAKEDPDVTLSAEEHKIGGLGIFLVKKSMDDMTYEYKDGKNMLTIVKKL